MQHTPGLVKNFKQKRKSFTSKSRKPYPSHMRHTGSPLNPWWSAPTQLDGSRNTVLFKWGPSTASQTWSFLSPPPTSGCLWGRVQPPHRLLSQQRMWRQRRLLGMLLLLLRALPLQRLKAHAIAWTRRRRRNPPPYPPIPTACATWGAPSPSAVAARKKGTHHGTTACILLLCYLLSFYNKVKLN